MTKLDIESFNNFIDEGLKENQTYFITHLRQSLANNVVELRLGRYEWEGEPYKSKVTSDGCIYFLFELPVE